MSNKRANPKLVYPAVKGGDESYTPPMVVLDSGACFFFDGDTMSWMEAKPIPTTVAYYESLAVRGKEVSEKVCTCEGIVKGFRDRETGRLICHNCDLPCYPNE